MRVEERRAKVAALALQGLRPGEIAARLGDTSATGRVKISQDLKAIRRAWSGSTIRNFDGHKQQLLDEIAFLKREAWAAWQRSKTDRIMVRDKELLTKAGRKRRRAEAATGDSGQPADELLPDNGLVVTGVEHETKTEPSTGDPRYLKVIADLVAEEAVLLGLAARRGEPSTSPPILAISVKVPEGYAPKGFTVAGVAVPPETTAPLAATPLPGPGGQDLPRLPPPPDDSGDWEWSDNDEEDNGDGLATET